MKLSSFLCCEKIILNSNEKPCIVDPLLELKLINVPSSYSFSLLLGLSDLNKNDNIRVELIAPDGEMVEIIDFDLPLPPNFDGKEDVPFKAMINLDAHNVEFKSLGIYSFKVKGNGEALSAFEIEVTKKEEI